MSLGIAQLLAPKSLREGVLEIDEDDDYELLRGAEM